VVPADKGDPAVELDRRWIARVSLDQWRLSLKKAEIGKG